MILNILSAVLPTLFSTIDKAVTDKDKANEIKAALQTQLLEHQGKELEAAAKVIIAEAQGHSWMQRNWRPSLMYLFGFIIFNNFVLYPYASLFTDKAVLLDTPQDLWDLIKIGMGGYLVGRSGEKMATIMKKGV